MEPCYCGDCWKCGVFEDVGNEPDFITKTDSDAMEQSFLSIEGRGLRLMMGDVETLNEWLLFQIAWKAGAEHERNKWLS